ARRRGAGHAGCCRWVKWPHWQSLAMPLLFGVFSPLSAVRGRAEDIAEETAYFDVLGL
ncbi:unnamed protein product, partial [Prorocentrum cordatum]